jgi:hypothetical protein
MRAMNPALELIRRVLLVTGEAVLLYVASRFVFERVLRTTWGRAPARRLLVGFLRLPGNILHESSHALGYFLAGYRVRRLVFFFIDEEGRGYCRPGRAWSPLALPWLATGFAALLPLAAGAAGLWTASVLLGVPEDPAALVTTDWRRLAEVLGGLDYRAWQTWLFLYLALSIGAELAPSEIDLWRSVPAVVVGAATIVLGIFTVFGLPAAEPLRRPLELYLSWALSWASLVLDFGIIALVLVGVPAAILVAPLRGR